MWPLVRDCKKMWPAFVKRLPTPDLGDQDSTRITTCRGVRAKGNNTIIVFKTDKYRGNRVLFDGDTRCFRRFYRSRRRPTRVRRLYNPRSTKNH